MEKKNPELNWKTSKGLPGSVHQVRSLKVVTVLPISKKLNKLKCQQLFLDCKKSKVSESSTGLQTGETNAQKSMSRKLCRNQSLGRATWAGWTHFWRLSVDNSERENSRRTQSSGRPHTLVSFISWSLDPSSHSEYLTKILCFLPAGGSRNHSEMCQNILLLM